MLGTLPRFHETSQLQNHQSSAQTNEETCVTPKASIALACLTRDMKLFTLPTFHFSPGSVSTPRLRHFNLPADFIRPSRPHCGIFGTRFLPFCLISTQINYFKDLALSSCPFSLLTVLKPLTSGDVVLNAFGISLHLAWRCHPATIIKL